MNRRCVARAVLGTDGMGCAAAAVLVAASGAVVPSVGLSPKARWPLVLALGATSATLLGGALRARPANRDLERAVVINAGWVAACVTGLVRRPSPLGAVLLAGTAAFDGAAAVGQWTLRSTTDGERAS